MTYLLRLSLCLGLLSAALPAAQLLTTQQPEGQQPGEQQKQEIWRTDYVQAKALAKQGGKDLLLDFTGSDWCGWCVKLQKEVFAVPEFQSEATKHFVLLELDYPRNKAQSQALKLQNAKLKKEFGIKSYPTVFLCDATGRPYAQTGYQKGGVGAYLEHLAMLRGKRQVRDHCFKQAAKLKGLEKAKVLAEGLLQLPENVIQHYQVEVAQVLELDKDNKAGLRAKFEAVQAKEGLKAELNQLRQDFYKLAQGREWKKAQALMNQFLKDRKLQPKQAQELNWHLAMAYKRGGNFESAMASLETALQADPKSRMAEHIKRVQAKWQAETAEKAD